MIYFIIAYVVFCTILFFAALYAQRLRNDVSLSDIAFLTMMSFVPLFNLVLVYVAYSEIRKHSNALAFLDKPIIKRIQ